MNKRFEETDNPKLWSKPKNRVDEVCMKHNIDYGNSMTLEGKHKAHRKMLNNFSLIGNPMLEKKMDRFIVKQLIGAKLKIGLGNAKND